MNYSDASSFGRRRFELRSDSIHVSGSQFNGTTFELELPYRELSPLPEKMKVYSPILKIGFWTTLIGILGIVIASVGQFNDEKPLFAMAYGPACIGFIMILLSLRKLEMIRFKSVAGVPALDIIKCGKFKSDYDSFVDELQKRIRNEKGA